MPEPQTGEPIITTDTSAPIPSAELNFSNLDDNTFTKMYEAIQIEYAKRNEKNAPVTPERSPYQDEVDAIDQSIIQRGLFGKFSPRSTGTMMHGEEIISRFRGDYYAIPESLDYRKSPDAKYLAPLMFFTSTLKDIDPYDINQTLLKKHFFARVPTPDGRHQTIDIFYKHVRDKDAFDNRDPGFVHTFFTMPNAEAEKLETMIRANPDTAELFFQTSAAGLERGSPEVPGIGRVKSEEIVIVNADNLPKDRVPSYKLKELIPSVTTTLKYSKPHGVIPPDQI